MSDKPPRERFVEAMRDLLDRHYGDKPEHRGMVNSCAIRFYGVARASDAFADQECASHPWTACPEPFAIVNPLHGDSEADHAEKHRAALRKEIGL